MHARICLVRHQQRSVRSRTLSTFIARHMCISHMRPSIYWGEDTKHTWQPKKIQWKLAISTDTSAAVCITPHCNNLSILTRYFDDAKNSVPTGEKEDRRYLFTISTDTRIFKFWNVPEIWILAWSATKDTAPWHGNIFKCRPGIVWYSQVFIRPGTRCPRPSTLWHIIEAKQKDTIPSEPKPHGGS